jgi:hypothetical protein
VKLRSYCAFVGAYGLSSLSAITLSGRSILQSGYNSLKDFHSDLVEK